MGPCSPSFSSIASLILRFGETLVKPTFSDPTRLKFRSANSSRQKVTLSIWGYPGKLLSIDFYSQVTHGSKLAGSYGLLPITDLDLSTAQLMNSVMSKSGRREIQFRFQICRFTILMTFRVAVK